jgi:hypothetical protein
MRTGCRPYPNGCRAYPAIWLLTTLVLFLTSCRAVGTSLSPMEATWQMLARQQPDAVDVRVLGVRQTPEGEVAVIYTYIQPPRGDEPGMHYTGVSFYRHAVWSGWQQTGGANGGSWPPPAPGQLVDYFTMRGRTTAIYGRVLSPAVGAVEASLSNGETVRDEANDRAFAIFAPDRVEVCRLRLLGADGQELGVDSFASDQPGNPCRAP